MLKSEREKVDFLIQKYPKINIISLSEEKTRDLASRFPLELFNDSFQIYWAGLDLPYGPSPDASLFGKIS